MLKKSQGRVNLWFLIIFFKKFLHYIFLNHVENPVCLIIVVRVADKDSESFFQPWRQLRVVGAMNKHVNATGEFEN